jgi:hypothetical protein
VRGPNLARYAWLLVGAVWFGGCSLAPPPSEEGVLWYLRNARVEGRVRRIWPAGQAYVDRILSLDAELTRARARLAVWTADTSLWGKDDPRWADPEAIDAHLEELEEVLDGEAHARRQQLRKLSEAIGEVPDSLPLGDAAAREAFEARVWAALAVDGVPLEDAVAELEALVARRRVLYEAARAGLDEAQHAALLRSMIERRDRFIAYAAERLAEIASREQQIDKRDTRDEFDGLFDERKYLRDALLDIPKHYYARAEEARAALLRAEQAGATSDVAVLAARVRKLEQQQQATRERVDAILRAAGRDVAE